MLLGVLIGPRFTVESDLRYGCKNDYYALIKLGLKKEKEKRRMAAAQARSSTKFKLVHWL